MAKRSLVLLAEGFEEIELVAPVDILRRAGGEVIMASITSDLQVRGRCGIHILADALLTDIDPSGFDLLILPGGPGVQNLRGEGRAVMLAKDFISSDRLVAAICAAPTLLAEAGLLVGKTYTAHFSVEQQLPDALFTERVVINQLITTSRGAGTALDFGLALVNRLHGKSIAEEVATSIMA